MASSLTTVPGKLLTVFFVTHYSDAPGAETASPASASESHPAPTAPGWGKVGRNMATLVHSGWQ